MPSRGVLRAYNKRDRLCIRRRVLERVALVQDHHCPNGDLRGFLVASDLECSGATIAVDSVYGASLESFSMGRAPHEQRGFLHGVEEHVSGDEFVVQGP